MSRHVTQLGLIFSYYRKHPNRKIQHKEAVDWATEEYKRITGKIFRDPDRGIRKLAQDGQLVKIDKGVYMYDPDHIAKRELEDFSPADKKLILKRYGYKCAICGKGKENGVELHVDHIKPKDLGGKAAVSNGQVLCAQHNFLKKNYNQTTTGKRMFIGLLEVARDSDDHDMIEFCEAILSAFDKFGMNGHIKWKKK